MSKIIIDSEKVEELFASDWKWEGVATAFNELVDKEGTVLPDNVTHGQLIMKIANEYYLETSNRCETVEIEIGGRITEFDGKWWNSPLVKKKND